MKVGFIGLGNMGQEMCKRLLSDGFDLTIYNRTRSKANDLEKLGASVAGSIAELAQGCDTIVSMVADDSAAEGIVRGQNGNDGLFAAMKPDCVHVSMSTLSPGIVQEMSAGHEKRSQKLLSAPVVGRPQAVEAKKLWIIAGGDPALIEKHQKLFAAFGQGVVNAGTEPHLANVVKLANNFMIAAFIEMFSEAAALAQKSGVEQKAFFELIANALLRSPIFEGYAKRILDREFEPAGFRLRLGLKDINLVLEAAESVEVPMPFASILHDSFLSSIGRGLGELDWSALSLLIEQNSGNEQK